MLYIITQFPFNGNCWRLSAFCVGLSLLTSGNREYCLRSPFSCVDWWLLCFVILYINVTEGEWKDVTARYASKWMTETRKLRVDPEWWSETLGVFRCEEDSTEDEEIKGQDWLIDWLIEWLTDGWMDGQIDRWIDLID